MKMAYYRIENRAHEEPATILFTSATRKDSIPPPPVRLSWDSCHPPPESVRTDGRTDGRTLTSEPKFSDQRVTKFAYPWCSASSAIMYTYLAIITTKRIKATKNRTYWNKGKYVL